MNTERITFIIGIVQNFSTRDVNNGVCSSLVVIYT